MHAARQRVPARALRIDGSVDVPGATGPAQLTLRVGDASYVHAVTLPTFSIPVPVSPQEAMVSIDVEAPGFRYASIVGSFRRTAAKAGPDAILDADELDRVRITALGTALHHYVRQRLGDRLPVSDLEHEQAVRSIGSEAVIAGYLLQALGDGRLSLPAGKDTGYALIADRQGMSDYIYSDPRIFEEWRDFAAQASRIPFPEAALGTNTAVVPARAYGEVDLGVRSASLFQRSGARSWYHAYSSAANAAVTVSAPDAETLQLTYEDPKRYSYYADIYDGPGPEPRRVRIDVEESQANMRRLFVGDRYSLLAVTWRQHTTFPDEPGRPPVDGSFLSIEHAFSLDAFSQTLRPEDIVGTHALPRFCMGTDDFGRHGLSDCEHVATTFFANGAGLQREIGDKVTPAMLPRTSGFTQQAFSWQAAARGRRGPLRMQVGSTDVQLWQLPDDDDVASQVLYLASAPAPDGSTHTLFGQSTLLHARATPVLTPSSLLGRWKYGSFEQERGDDFWSVAEDRSVFTRTADGVTREDVTYADPRVTPRVRPSAWQLVDFPVTTGSQARLYETRVMGGNGRFYPDCGAAAADGQFLCRMDRVRYFRPMAQSGNRTYGLEELYINTGDFNQPVQATRSSRMNYHERIPTAPMRPEATPRRSSPVAAAPVRGTR